jgi:hypothetical protein
LTLPKGYVAWRQAVADTIPKISRGLEPSVKITKEQVLQWIEADKTKIPAVGARIHSIRIVS